MPRIALSSAEVAAAFEKILSQGEQPTAEKIHTLLGKGTLPLIQKHIHQIIAQSRQSLVTKDEPKPAADLFAATFATEPEKAPTPAPALPSEIPVIQPAVETAAPTENTGAQQNNGQNRRPFKRERFNNRSPNNNSPNNHSHHQHPQQHRHVEIEEAVEIPLEQLPEEALLVKVRRLESILMKEEMRREVSERIMIETKDYAESIKEQVAQRINDLRQNMDEVIEQLKNQLQEQKHSFDQDLRYYQEQLAKANEKIAVLLK